MDPRVERWSCELILIKINCHARSGRDETGRDVLQLSGTERSFA
jgi:hypothetical protein